MSRTSRFFILGAALDRAQLIDPERVEALVAARRRARRASSIPAKVTAGADTTPGSNLPGVGADAFEGEGRAA